MWITKEQAKAKDKSVKGHSDKRQFTLLAATSAAGQMLKHQLVVAGSTKKTFPKFATSYYKATYSALNSKGLLSACFVLTGMVAAVANIGSFCATANHWSDPVTSRAYIMDIVVPYFKAMITELRAIDPSACKAFTEQICVVIVDCWWGWLDADFKSWLAATYPWIRLLFVPAACTPVAQPMDAGIIAKIKGILRRLYGAWVVMITQEQIKAGVKPEEIKVPMDVPTCKKNLFTWLSESTNVLNNDKTGIVHCWESTKLLRA